MGAAVVAPAADEAVETLYRMARRVVARSLRPVRDRMLDGEDLVQEAVIRAYRALMRLPSGVEGAQARGWLYRVMRLAVWDALSRAHRSAETRLDPVRIEDLEDADDQLLVAAADLLNERVAGRMAAAQAVRMVVPLLTPVEREALALRMADLAAGRLRAMPSKRLDNALLRVQRKARRLLAGETGRGQRDPEGRVLSALARLPDAAPGGPGVPYSAVARACGYAAGSRWVASVCLRLEAKGHLERVGAGRRRGVLWRRTGR